MVQGLLMLSLAACELQTTTPTPPPATLTPSAAVSSTETEAPAAETPLPSDIPVPTPENLNSYSLPEGYNPLTGLPVEDQSLLDRRPIAVKVTLYPRSNRPQWGLGLADIVYEYYHNNDLTRFNAIFYGQNADWVGPIRSARLPDEHLMETYKSVLAFASADSRIREALYNRYPAWRLISILEGECPPNPVCRYDPEVYNHLLANTARLSDYVDATDGDNDKPNLEGMHFADQKPKTNDEVERIYTTYSYGSYNYWEYDAGERVYYRYQDAWDAVGGRERSYYLLTDRLTGNAISADNVVVLFTNHFHTVYVPANGSTPETEVVDMDFVGSGEAYAFRNGLAYELVWKREAGGMLALQFADGTPYDFKPGNTWFQVVNDSSRLDREGNSWYFTFVWRKN